MELYIYQGILLGLALSALVGPLFFALLEAGLSNGFKGGLVLASGIWCSDFLFLIVVWQQLEWIRLLSEKTHFSLVVGVLGGLILIISGVFGWLSHKKVDLQADHILLPTSKFGLWSKGFFTNTVNPFTVFFWLTVVTEFVTKPENNFWEGLSFFGAMLFTVVCTDVLKVLLARKISGWLNPQKLRWFGKSVSVLLLVFGVILILRVL